MYGQSKRDFETRNPGPVDALPALAHLVGQRRSARCRQFTCGCNATSAFCDEGRWPQDEREGDLDGQSEMLRRLLLTSGERPEPFDRAVEGPLSAMGPYGLFWPFLHVPQPRWKVRCPSHCSRSG